MLPLRRKGCVGSGARSIVYRASQTIVVKAPDPTSIDARPQPFLQEAEFYKLLLEQKDRCPDIVECFLAFPDYVFLSYCPNNSLAHRLYEYQEREKRPNGFPGKLIRVKQYEDPALIARWIQQLTSALAYMEKMGYTHNDLHPRNCLLDENLNLKLCDFDHATTIGQFLESLMAPWAIMLSSGPLKNTYGLTSARTEQFAVGTFLYCMVYGHEPYEDINLQEDPVELRRRFDNMEFPELNRHEVFDKLIFGCWYTVYSTMALVAYDFKRKTNSIALAPDYMVIDYAKQKSACEKLIQNGLLGPELALLYLPVWQRHLHAVMGKALIIWKNSVHFLRTIFRIWS